MFSLEKIIKNIAQEVPVAIAEEVAYQPGQIVSKTLAQDTRHSLTLFAFAKGEEISTHASDGDAMVLMLDGKSKITVAGTPHILEKGETIIMPARKPHALFAEENFKMLLIVLFPEHLSE